MSTVMQHALEQIRDDIMPCRECGEIHAERPDTSDPAGERWTWAAKDGHNYRRMTPRELAAQVLRGGSS